MGLTILIWILVLIMFIVMIIVLIKGAPAWVYVFDEFNGMKKYRAKTIEGKVSFNHNSSSKGGVGIERNVYKFGKKKVYLYRDVGGVLLPITDKKLSDKERSFDLSTSQEKLYETQALKNVIEKIDHSWWSAIKPYIGAFIIVFGAVIVSIVMIKQATQIEPVPQPEVMMFNNVTHAMIDLTESNKKLIETITQDKNPESKNNKPPK